jgi:hypothetical protein
LNIFKFERKRKNKTENRKQEKETKKERENNKTVNEKRRKSLNGPGPIPDQRCAACRRRRPDRSIGFALSS